MSTTGDPSGSSSGSGRHEISPFVLYPIAEDAFSTISSDESVSPTILSKSMSTTTSSSSTTSTPQRHHSQPQQPQQHQQHQQQQHDPFSTNTHSASSSPQANTSSRHVSNSSSSSQIKLPTLRVLDASSDRVWAGTSDGSLKAYETVPAPDDKMQCACLASKRLSSRPVEKLTALPQLDRLLILCDNVLTFYSLSTLEPLSNPQPIRGVLTFDTDGQSDIISPPAVCVAVVKREGVILCGLMENGIQPLNEVPLESAVYLSVLRGMTLCAANVSEYFIVDFTTGSTIPLLPICQTASQDTQPNPNQRPAIAAINSQEFLIASHTGESTLGVFLRSTGDPCRGTLQWPSNVRSIVVDSPHIIALLRDGTVQIHNLVSQELVQVIQLPTSVQPRSLCVCSTYPLQAITGAQDARLSLVPFQPPYNSISISTSASVPGPGPDSAPSTPQRFSVADISISSADSVSSTTQSSSITTTNPFSLIHDSTAQTLIVGKTSIYALFPISLIAQADSLLKKRKFDDAVNLAGQIEDQGRRNQLYKSKQYTSMAHHAKDGPSPEVCYIYQYVAFRYLFETRFEDAGQLFFKGRVDPRYLIQLFLEYRDNNELHDKTTTTVLSPSKSSSSSLASSSSSYEIQIFQGLEMYASRARSIHDIITSNLNRNYSPHIKPDIESSPAARDLSTILNKRALKMLRTFLQNWKSAQPPPGHPNEAHVDILNQVDTTLAKFLSDDNDQDELIKFIDSSPYCSLDKLATYLRDHKRLNKSLANIYLKLGQISQALEIYKLIYNENQDESILKIIFDLCNKLSETDSLLTNGLWLLKRNADYGLKVLMNIKCDDSNQAEQIINQVNDIDKEVANILLESFVFKMDSKIKFFHDQLVSSYLRELKQYLTNESNANNLSDKALEFSCQSSGPSISYLDFILQSQKLSNIDWQRLKLIILLDSSNMYDVTKAKLILETIPVLTFEQAIVYSKLGLHERTLSLLVNELCDFMSAEIYCSTMGSSFIPIRTIRSILERLNLANYEKWRKDDSNTKSQTKKKTTKKDGIAAGNNNTTSPFKTRKEWFTCLVDVCLEPRPQNLKLKSQPIEKEERRRKETSRLINTQAMNLDTLHVLSRVPDDWPLKHLSSFFERTLRRDFASSNETRIIKSIASGQNFSFGQVSMTKQREFGPHVVATNEQDYNNNNNNNNKHHQESSLAKQVLREDELKREKQI